MRERRTCEVRELGRIGYARGAWRCSSNSPRAQRGEGADQLLLLEHPHVITLGRNGHLENLLASDEILDRAGISFFPTDRGGDVTYHGPGQLVGYPILDLREWKRDVGAYVRAVEQTIIDTLADYGIAAGRIPKLTGVWVGEQQDRRHRRAHQPLGDLARLRSECLHRLETISSTSFRADLTKPVTSMAALGVRATLEEVATHPGRAFRPHIRLRDAPEGLASGELI